MTRPEVAGAAASWQELTTCLRRLSDRDFAALSPAALAPVGVPVRVRFGVQAP